MRNSNLLDIEQLVSDLANQVADQVIDRLESQKDSSRFEDEPQDGHATAQWLKVDVQTLERLRKAGKVPFARVGRRVLYRPADVLAALSSSNEH